MADDKQEYLRVLASLETNALAILYRQSVNGDPVGMTRADMLKALDEMDIPEDFHRKVGAPSKPVVSPFRKC